MWRKRWNWIKLFTQASPSSLISYKRKLQVIIHLLLVFFYCDPQLSTRPFGGSEGQNITVPQHHNISEDFHTFPFL